MGQPEALPLMVTDVPTFAEDAGVAEAVTAEQGPIESEYVRGAKAS
jgi:hypothetical protein